MLEHEPQDNKDTVSQSVTPIPPTPTVMSSSSTASAHQSTVGNKRWLVPGVILLCFIASFLGAGAFIHSGLIKTTDSSQSVTQSRQKLVQEGEVVADVAKNVSPSVVSIVTESSAQSYFGSQATQQSAGTGIIISKDGYIMTNRHVIPTGANNVQVVLSDGTSYENVRVVGRDSLNDLAFLKISGVNNLAPAKLGDSGNVEVGQKVTAIGNALGQYQTTVTSGIISAIGRPLTASDESGNTSEQLENLLQTDAAINPGNSGGPLVNLSGEIIGINTAVAQDAQGIGFAIPINDAKGLIKSVIESGQLKRAYLGVRYVSITPDVVSQLKLPVKNGAYVSDAANAIVDGSPAAKAGLKSKDIITKVNDTAVNASYPLSSQLSQFVPGDAITLSVLRDGKTIQLRVTLAQYNN